MGLFHPKHTLLSVARQLEAGIDKDVIALEERNRESHLTMAAARAQKQVTVPHETTEMTDNEDHDGIPLWKPTFQTLYETYFQELSCEAIMQRWEAVSITAGFFMGITASGSAVTGWALWNKPGWKMGWAALAGVTAVISIVHGLLQVTRRLNDQGKLRSRFSQLRVDLETFGHKLAAGMNEKAATKTFESLRDRFSACMGDAHPDIAYTKKMRYRVQTRLNAILKENGYIQ
jgi:hypothetical protein